MHSIGNHQQNEKIPTEWEKVFANDLINNGLMSKIYNSTPKKKKQKQKTWYKNGQKTWIDIFPEKTEMANRHRKRCFISLCKSKPQSSITSHQSEWLSSKSPQVKNAWDGMEKRDVFYTIDGTANWCSHYGKQYGIP